MKRPLVNKRIALIIIFLLLCLAYCVRRSSVGDGDKKVVGTPAETEVPRAKCGKACPKCHSVDTVESTLVEIELPDADEASAEENGGVAAQAAASRREKPVMGADVESEDSSIDSMEVNVASEVGEEVNIPGERPDSVAVAVVNQEEVSQAAEEIPDDVEEVVQAKEWDGASAEDTSERLEAGPLALKNNLLYDGILLPNLELEWLVAPHWSGLIEGAVAWYDRNEKFQCYRLAFVNLEGRYYFRPTWRGMYAGAFGGGTRFDLENKKTGYQGHGAMAGVSFGYVWGLSRHFFMEAGIGVGYLYARYKEYIPRDGHFLYQREKTLNYFGPLRLRLSIMWRFGSGVKKASSNLSNLAK